jgi:uncharacterized membrane protein
VTSHFDKTARAAYLLVLGLVALWIAGALVAPVGIAHGWISADQSPAIRPGGDGLADLLAVIIHGAYGRVCHQIPERSVWVQGHPIAVCARCFGIYLGYFAGLLIYPVARERLNAGLPPRRWLILALSPVAVDFAGGYLGLFENTLASRTATGLIAGVAVAIYTAPGLIAATGSALGSISAWHDAWPLKQPGGAHNG